MEIRTFLLMLLGGVALNLIIDIYRAFVRAFLVKGRLLQILDFLIALFSLLLVFSIIIPGNWGSLRLYVFLGLAGGILVYKLLFGQKILLKALFLFRKLRS